MNPMDEKGLGERLQKARRTSGLTQQALCQKAGLSYSTLAKIERGAIKAPSIFTIQRIALALNTSLDTLMEHKLAAGGTEAAPVTARSYSKTQSGASFIYFDINGTLIRFYQGAFTRLSEETGLSPDQIETAFWHLNDAACRGQLNMEDFNHRFSERLGLVHAVEWPKYYLEAVEPIVGMQELVRWAREHYRIGILSNTMPGLLPALRQQGIIPDLQYDAVIDSSEVGTIKPEERIFTIASERAGCKPQEILLIDDTRANLMAAEGLGWHTISFDGYHTDDSVAKIRQALTPASMSFPA